MGIQQARWYDKIIVILVLTYAIPLMAVWGYRTKKGIYQDLCNDLASGPSFPEKIQDQIDEFFGSDRMWHMVLVLDRIDRTNRRMKP